MANPVAKFKTSKGEFDVELYMDKLPIGLVLPVSVQIQLQL